MAAGGLPDLLTVEEAAVLLRIGRNKAYSLARQWRATNGRCGLPVVEFGHTLRVPRYALEQMLGVTFTAWPTEPGPPESGISPPDNGLPLCGDSASPRTSAGGAAGAGPVSGVGAGLAKAAGASNVTPIRRRRGRGGPAQLPLFPPAGPAAESP